jgi:hypothetical protein
MWTSTSSTRSRILALSLAMILLPRIASAQTTFVVTEAAKTAAHPYFGQGHDEGWIIDGVQGKELTLVRGTTYTFQLQNVEDFHPFYISTSDVGAGAGAYNNGVTGAPATGNSIVTFTPDVSAPDLLWYQCMNHQKMGWKIHIVNATSGVGIHPARKLSGLLSNPTPNPVRTTASLTLQVERQQHVQVALYSSTGEKLATIHDGVSAPEHPATITFDAGSLPNGIYEIVARGESFVEHRKVVVGR